MYAYMHMDFCYMHKCMHKQYNIRYAAACPKVCLYMYAYGVLPYANTCIYMNSSGVDTSAYALVYSIYCISMFVMQIRRLENRELRGLKSLHLTEHLTGYQLAEIWSSQEILERADQLRSGGMF